MVLGPEVGSFLLGLTGLPDAFLALRGVLRWVLAFLAVTVAYAVLYYLAPNASLPFKWATPGVLSATIPMFISSAALPLYAANFGHYDQIYGQLRAVIVTMLWLYLYGAGTSHRGRDECRTARIVEERKGVTLVRSGSASI